LPLPLAEDTVFEVLLAVRRAGADGCTLAQLTHGLWPNGRVRIGKPPVPRHRLERGAGQMAQQCVSRGLLNKHGGGIGVREKGHIRYRITHAGEAFYERYVAAMNAAAAAKTEDLGPGRAAEAAPRADVELDELGWSR
jgi:hypothetical protein